MMYVVNVWHLGKLVTSARVLGMDKVQPYLAVYDGRAGYEVQFEPDVFAYMALNQNEQLS